MPILRRSGLALSYTDRGAGPAFVFQHGLGGDASQPASQAPADCRLITLECRGHGATPLGPEEELGFETFARDVDSLLDELRLSRVVVGGISMGAGVALRLAWLRPGRARALVLVRPAWLDRGQPPNLRVYSEIATVLREHPPEEARARFVRQSPAYRRTLERSPSAAASLVAQFDRPGARERSAVLERLPADSPLAAGADWSALSMPALVVAARNDDIHPFAYASMLHERLPGATLCEVPPKDTGDAAHRRAVAAVIGRFLGQVASEEPPEAAAERPQ